MCQVHPKTIYRWVRFLNLKVFRPTKITVRIPDDQVKRLLTPEPFYPVRRDETARSVDQA